MFLSRTNGRFVTILQKTHFNKNLLQRNTLKPFKYSPGTET